MKKTILASMLLLVVSGSAFASASCNGNQNCDSTTNTTNNQGGTGVGIGGDSTAVGIGGDSSAVIQSGAIKNNNTNKNTNKNTNIQGQQQGQLQGQVQSQAQSANANASSSASTDNSGNNTGTATVSYNTQRNPVSTAYAAPLTSSTDTCMGSSSAGGQGITFGFSFATTWTDSNCIRLKNARELAVTLGDKDAAKEVMCGNADVNAVYKALNRPCLMPAK